MANVEDKLEKLRLEYLAHASLVIEDDHTAMLIGRKFLQLCNNKNPKPAEYFCCVKCGLPRARDQGLTHCSGCDKIKN